MPTGDSNLDDKVKIETISVTFIGMLIILFEILRKSLEPVESFSNYNGEKEK